MLLEKSLSLKLKERTLLCAFDAYPVAAHTVFMHTVPTLYAFIADSAPWCGDTWRVWLLTAHHKLP